MWERQIKFRQIGLLDQTDRTIYCTQTDGWPANMATKSVCTSGLSTAHVKSFPIVACVLPWLLLQEGLGTKEHKSIRKQPSLASKTLENPFFFFQYQIRISLYYFYFLNPNNFMKPCSRCKSTWNLTRCVLLYSNQSQKGKLISRNVSAKNVSHRPFKKK